MMGKGNAYRGILILCALFLSGGPGFVFTDIEPPPRSYQVISSDGQFVFVMLAQVAPQDDGDRWPPGQQKESQEVRQKYPKSGLYRNDGATEPNWTVDWYARSVHLLPGGIHLIRHGRWPARSRSSSRVGPVNMQQEAMSFFANGKLLRRYMIGELIHNPERLLPSSSHFLWQDRYEVDEDRLTYKVVTFDGYRYQFDVKTGEITATESGVATSSPRYPSSSGRAAIPQQEVAPNHWPRTIYALMPMMLSLALGGVIFLAACLARLSRTIGGDAGTKSSGNLRQTAQARPADSGPNPPPPPEKMPDPS